MNRTRFLLQTAAIYGVIGVFIGSHMAGAGSYAFRPIHAHILLVGWLSLFAFAMYYRVYPIPHGWLSRLHVWTAFIGAFGLTAGMALYYLVDAPGMDVFNLIFYIVGGTILAISFVLFMLMTFVHGKHIQDNSR